MLERGWGKRTGWKEHEDMVLQSTRENCGERAVLQVQGISATIDAEDHILYLEVKHDLAGDLDVVLDSLLLLLLVAPHRARCHIADARMALEHRDEHALLRHCA
jgi:hypothetical protein